MNRKHWVIEKKWKPILAVSTLASYISLASQPRNFIDISFPYPLPSQTTTSTKFYYLFWLRVFSSVTSTGEKEIFCFGAIRNREKHENHIEARQKFALAQFELGVVVSGEREWVGKIATQSRAIVKCPNFHFFSFPLCLVGNARF